MNFEWYPFNPTEYRRKTYHLCAAADGIYRRLIDEYMLARAPLPDDDAALAAIARVSMAEWLQHKPVLRAFFRPKNGRLINPRCEKELDAQRMRHALRSRVGKEAATIRWGQAKRYQQDKYQLHANGMPYPMPMDATRQDKDISKEKTEKEKLRITPQLVTSIKAKGWS